LEKHNSILNQQYQANLKKMKISFKTNILPHLLILTGFYLLVVFYFSPIIFEDQKIFQFDILQWEGGAKEVLDYQETTGDQLLWTNRLFGGMPTYLVNFKNSGDITELLTGVLTLGLPHPINSIFMALLAMYALLLSFKVKPEIAAIGAIAFAFNSFHMISLDAGHNAKIWALALIPLVLTGMQLIFKDKKALGFAIFSLALMLQLKYNHIQITYYTVIIALVFFIGASYLWYKEGKIKFLPQVIGLLLLGGVLSLGANISRIALVYEYGAFSNRAPSNIESDSKREVSPEKEYAFNWSQGKAETLTLLIPYIYGGASNEKLPKKSATEIAMSNNNIDFSTQQNFINKAPTYWGDQPGTGGPIYGGAIMIFLFVLGLFYAPRTWSIVFFSLTILSFVLAWGKNLESINFFIFDFVPGYSKFRAVSMALGIALFTIPFLGILGLDKMLKTRITTTDYKKLAIAVASTAGLSILIYFISGTFNLSSPVDANFPSWLTEALIKDRKQLIDQSALLSAFWIVAASGLIFAFFKNKISLTIVGLGISFLLILDLWMINKKYLNDESFIENPRKEYFSMTPAENQIFKDKSDFRVFNLENPFNEAKTSYYFNSIGGYHGAKLRRYQELIENVISPEINAFIQKAQEGNFEFENLGALNMLNTKYILAGKSENAVILNPAANGHAWMPKIIKSVSSNEEELSMLSQIDTKTEVTLSTENKGAFKIGEGKIELMQRGADTLIYSANITKPGIGVFSEIYYPLGWKAYIDNKEIDIMRVNYTLRGLDLPNGSYEIKMIFRPETYFKTKNYVAASQYLITLLLLGTIFLEGFKLRSK
jgi:hypothetical protein